MIRFVSTTSLLALLIMVLYLPSAYSPQHFIEQIRIEHGLNKDFWGEVHAVRILARTLNLQATAKQANSVPASTTASSSNINLAVAKQMADVNNRLFNNSYFQSINTLLVLGTYRLATLLEWLPLLSAFIAVVLLDGFLIRIIKFKEFMQHRPEVFALHACAAIVLTCATVVSFVLPLTLHPLILPAIPLALSIFLNRATVDFHYAR